MKSLNAKLPKILFIKAVLFAAAITFLSLNLFTACSSGDSGDDSNTSSGKTEDKGSGTGTKDDNKDSEEKENPADSSKSYITLTNSTSSNLEVYDDSLRNTLLATVAPGESKKVEAGFGGGITEKVLYLTYHVDVGTDVPFYDNSSYAIFTSDGTKEKKVTYPEKMDIKDAYIILENSYGGTDGIELMRGSSPLPPCGKSSTVLSKGESAVYKISDAKLTNLNYSSFKIADLNGNKIPLPSAISYFEKSVIYTVSYNGKTGQLVSKTPFNAETKKKIWSRKSYGTSLSQEQFITHCLRSRHNAPDGSLICGVLNPVASSREQTAKIMLIDEYGKLAGENVIAISDEKLGAANTYLFYDILETSAGEFTALVQAGFSGGENKIYFLALNSSLETTKWIYQIDKDSADYLFSVNTKGKISEIDGNTFALCGSRNNVPFVEKISYSASDNTVTAKYIEVQGASSNYNSENIFTSMVYNGSDFILTGYENFDGEYSASNPHIGTVYKIDGNLEKAEKIYSKENCLFYGISADKKDSGKYYICGEAVDNGNALRGCFLSSDMIEKNKSPLLFRGSKEHAWFTQLCADENRITFNGETSADKSGSGGCALVMAMNTKGEEMWRNEFDGYSAVYSCMENGIGSFLLELFNEDTKQSKIVSTDLLGKDTGAELDTFGK